MGVHLLSVGVFRVGPVFGHPWTRKRLGARGLRDFLICVSPLLVLSAPRGLGGMEALLLESSCSSPPVGPLGHFSVLFSYFRGWIHKSRNQTDF